MVMFGSAWIPKFNKAFDTKNDFLNIIKKGTVIKNKK